MKKLLIIVVVTLVATADPDPPERTTQAPGWVLAAPAGSRDGRAGDAHLRRGDLDAAEERYQRGLERAGARGTAAPALLNNLGVVHFERGDAERAEELFAEAEAAARTDADAARAAYNAGTAAAARGELGPALAHYRRALLLQPDFPEARYNFEVLARMMRHEEPRASAPDEQPDTGSRPPSQEEDVGDGPPHPSDDGEEDPDGELSDTPGDEQGRSDESDPDPDANGQRDGDTGQEGDASGQAGADAEAEPGPDGQVSREEAERILRAIEAEEQEVLREVQRRRSRTRGHERDW